MPIHSSGSLDEERKMYENGELSEKAQLWIEKNTSKNPAAEIWKTAVESSAEDVPDELLGPILQHITINNPPEYAELTINGDCKGKCRHCIYRPDHAKFNKSIEPESWKKIIDNLYDALVFRKFVFNGRDLSDIILDCVRHVKEKEGVWTGVITECFGLERYFDRLKEMGLQSLDVSLDGTRQAHDMQRNREGSYDKTIAQLERVKKGYFVRELSLLTCATSINIDSIPEMIREANEIEILNYFVTPVNFYNGRPDSVLQSSKKDFKNLVYRLIETSEKLNRPYVQLTLYEERDMAVLKEMAGRSSKIYDELETDNNRLIWRSEEHRGGNFQIVCYPGSLTSTLELPIDPRGRMIPPKIMALGKIPPDYDFGSVLDINSPREEYLKKHVKKDAFKLHVNEFRNARKMLA